jgi:hypothetical protein
MSFHTTTLLVCASFIASAQSVTTQIGGRVAGMGYASAATSDEWSLFNNVGALGQQKQSAVCFAYDATPNLPGAGRMAAAISLATKIGTAGIGTFKFGDAAYSEQTAAFGFSNKFGIASLGLKINYIQYEAAGFQSRNAISVSFGGLAAITPQVAVGAHIANLNQASLTESQKLPTTLAAGICLRPDEHILISTEVEKDLQYNARWKTGMEYSVHKKIFFRSGFHVNPAAGFFGIGVVSKKIKCDFATRIGSVQGNSYQASATYAFHTREKK